MVVLLLAILLLVPASASAASGSPSRSPLPRWGIDGAFARGASPTASAARIRTRRWVNGVQVTEYWPVPEAWFKGRRLKAPGLGRKARVDWLYSARGVSMEGDGIGLDGKRYHIDSLGSAGWINKRGRSTAPGGGELDNGAPWWRNARIWYNRAGRPTFPLSSGGWYRGSPRRYVPNKGITFAPGPSTDLTYWKSVAVDPDVIALGSRIYIPAYKDINGGWFVAADVGGAITRKHIDVFRPPPSTAFGDGRNLEDQRVLVVPPGAR